MAPTHRDLVALGARWLRKQGFPVVATELSAAGCREVPDVVGFRSTCTAIIEAKASRADFLADDRKPERSGRAPGVGLYRFYLSPAGVALPAELPAGWGLLHEVGGRVREIVRPTGNRWPPGGVEGEWLAFQHPVNTDAERAVLFSIARRLAAVDRRTR
ncbi:hypothetical protein [Nitrospirillum amazonense]|uniref:hypothetical protein n=1 Tax=Nitrospirillum amazonense TaxID=28077 RepID=UPI003BB20195